MILYVSEVDTYLPHLTVEETLTFAVKTRTTFLRRDGQVVLPASRIGVMLCDVVIAVFGVSYIRKTRIESDSFAALAVAGEKE
jgi:hypothetical protein